MNQLSLTLFGSFAAVSGSQSLRLPTDKTRALLAYLALTADIPLRREMLAGLLWPEQTEVLARQNLRKTIGRLKQAIHSHDPALADQLLSVTKQTIELQAAYCTVDVLMFRSHLAAPKHAHKSLAQCAGCLANLEAAVRLYRQGDLLAGLSLPDASPFEEWLLMERENLYQQQLAALHQLATAYEQQEAFEEARQFALWQIQHEPWREEAHRQLMRILAVQGQRAEALAQYQACRRILQSELAVEPAAETEALLTQIMDGSLPVVASRTTTTAHPQPWPRLAGRLIGREADMARIVSLLADPDCRVLTLTGIGGIGKTSLAVAVGEQLGQQQSAWLADGLYFVPLAEVTNASLLPAAVAEALGLSLNQRQSIAAQVEQFVRHKALLLILDNFEQLVMDVAWLHTLSTTCADLKLLVTSREPLSWQGEWRYPLEGLAYPQDGAAGGQFDGGQFEAVQLFVQAARQVQPGFAYTPEDGRAIARICQLVDGWPLALQMAAAWVRMMNCHAIADQISASLDFLTTSLRDVPQRQRSMRAIFEHTWASLAADERSVLQRLAVFRGGFSLSAAVETAGASPLMLRSLVDKSLVQYAEQSGRYNMHEMLRQFAVEQAQADPDIHYLAQQTHSRYYLQLLQDQGERLNTTEFQSALEGIKADIDNLRQAWLWAAGSQQHDLLTRGLSHMAKFYESGGLPQEAVAIFQRTLSVLEESSPDRPASLSAYVLYHMAGSMISMGQYGDATAAVIRAQKIAQSLDDVTLTSLLYMTRAHIFREQGRYEQTHAVLQEAIAFSYAHNNLHGVALALHTQGNTYWSMADYEQAMKCYEEGRQIYQLLGQANATAILTGNIGVVLWRLGRYQEALANYEVALDSQRQIGNASKVAIWLGNIGLLYVDLHEDERARAFLDESLMMHDQLGRKYYKIEVLLGKVALCLRAGDIDAAVQLHKQAADLSSEISNRTYLLDCDLWQARLFVAQARLAEAAQLLQSLRVREFRPDVSATIAQELALLAGTPASASPGGA